MCIIVFFFFFLKLKFPSPYILSSMFWYCDFNCIAPFFKSIHAKIKQPLCFFHSSFTMQMNEWVILCETCSMVGQIRVSMVNEFLVPIKGHLKPIILEVSSTYGWVCHARMHGFIHDGRLWACPSCLLGLMYVLRWLYTIRCLGF
jgi:hypothetical protein